MSDKYTFDKRKSLNLSTPPAGVPGRTGGDSNNGDCPCPGVSMDKSRKSINLFLSINIALGY